MRLGTSPKALTARKRTGPARRPARLKRTTISIRKSLLSDGRKLARVENRSFSSFVSVLIQQAWDARADRS